MLGDGMCRGSLIAETPGPDKGKVRLPGYKD